MPAMQPRITEDPIAVGSSNCEANKENLYTRPVARDEVVTLVGNFKAFRGLGLYLHRNDHRAAGSTNAASADRPPNATGASNGPSMAGLKSSIDQIAPSVRSVKDAFEKVDGCMRSLLSRRSQDSDVLNKLKNKWKDIKEVSCINREAQYLNLCIQSYLDVLRDSSAIAIQGASTIKGEYYL